MARPSVQGNLIQGEGSDSLKIAQREDGLAMCKFYVQYSKKAYFQACQTVSLWSLVFPLYLEQAVTTTGNFRKRLQQLLLSTQISHV